MILVVALSSLAASDEPQISFHLLSAEVETRWLLRSMIRGTVAAAVDLSGEHLPLMVRWSNWRPEFGPAYVYARERDLNGMLDLDAPVDKMLMVASYDEVQRLMGQADQLKAAGVTTIGFNSENGTGMTLPDEMQTLNSADPNVNVVARAARLATENGFKSHVGTGA